MADVPRTTAAPLSREWMIEMFGEPYPAEVIDILFNRETDGETMGAIREEVKRLGEQRRQEREEAAHAK